jgi:hypothetical protein
MNAVVPGLPASHIESEPTRWYRSAFAVVACIAVVKLLLHLATASRYGYFRDELYYIACSRHLDWGYVDQPPLIAVLTWLELHAGGKSLLSLRFLPALAGAGLVVLTAFVAREMGARRFAIWFAALATACTGIYFVMDYLMTMNAFEPLFWMGCAYVVVRIINTGDQKLWLWFGVLAGLGLQNKYSMGIFGFAMVIGLLLTPVRKAFGSRWIWVAGGVALLIFLPNLLWNIQHHWPFLELMRNIKASGRDIEMSPLSYVGRQVFLINPILFPIWLIGLLSLFFLQEGRRYRALAWAYVVALVVMIVLKGKDYYLAPAYPMLLAAGAVAIERFVEWSRQGWLKPALAVVTVAATVPLLPLGVPVLSVENFLRYESKLPFSLPVSEKSHRGAAMPQYYSDQFGWEEMTAAVARIYQDLPPAERSVTCIAASNYGEAGAIDFFGPKYGLPSAISAHQNYFLWGPRDCTGKVLIALGDRLKDWAGRCEKVEVAAQLYHPYGIKFENKPVILCHDFKMNPQEIWPKLKDWD